MAGRRSRPRIGLLIFLQLGCLLFSHLALAGSATWNLSPVNNAWTNAVNWTPATVPNGPVDIATFAVSNATAVSVASQITVDRIVFNPGASTFTIQGNGPNLTFDGLGVVNNSGIIQNFLCATTNRNAPGLMSFTGAAGAGGDVVFTASGGASASQIRFMDEAHAATATFVTQQTGSSPGEVEFHDQSSAASGSFGAFGSTSTAGDGGYVLFYDNSSASQGVFSTYASDQSLAGIGGHVEFYGSSTAGNSVITNFGAQAGGSGFGDTAFQDSSSAGSAQITNEGGYTFFSTGGDGGNAVITNKGSSSTFARGETDFFPGTAGSATVTSEGSALAGGQGGLTLIAFYGDAASSTLIANGGPDANAAGSIRFENRSVGGTARVILSGNGNLDISNHNLDPLIVGSVEGEGEVYLGENPLAIGSNNLDTVLAAIIQDGGYSGGVGGSLIKMGDGSLELSGANTYTGGTTLSAGALIVSNATGSGTGTGPVLVTAGTLGGGGTISGSVTIGTGDGPGAYLAPAFGTTKELSFTIHSALTVNADATYTYTFRAKKNKSRADLVIANGVTINDAAVNLSGQVKGSVKEGLVLTLISNTSANPISGTFSNLADGAVVNIGGSNFQTSYKGGDGNDLTLTAVP